MSIREWWRCLRGFHEFKFIKNYYGDEVNKWDARSMWRCGNCGAEERRDYLFHRPPKPKPPPKPKK